MHVLVLFSGSFSFSGEAPAARRSLPQSLSLWQHRAYAGLPRSIIAGSRQGGQRNFAKRNFAKCFAKRNFAKCFAKFLFRISRNFILTSAKFRESKYMKISRNFAKVILQNCTETNFVFFYSLILIESEFQLNISFFYNVFRATRYKTTSLPAALNQARRIDTF